MEPFPEFEEYGSDDFSDDGDLDEDPELDYREFLDKGCFEIISKKTWFDLSNFYDRVDANCLCFEISGVK